MKPSRSALQSRKKVIALALLIIVTGFLYYQFAGNVVTGKVVFQKEEIKIVRAVDGDTVELYDGRKVRMLGINTPEKNKSYYQEAKELTKQTENKTGYLESAEKDMYGRTLGYIFVNDKMINEELLKLGFAHSFIYTPDKYTSRLLAAEKIAQESELGIWKKSKDFGCLIIREFQYKEDGKRCTNKELLVVENFCSSLSAIIKDSATHEFAKTFEKGINSMNFSCIFNDEGDSIYISDSSGLLAFERY